MSDRKPLQVKPLGTLSPPCLPRAAAATLPGPPQLSRTATRFLRLPPLPQLPRREIPTWSPPKSTPHAVDPAKPQYDATKLGILVLVTTEIMIFGGLIVAYLIFRNLWPEAFRWGHQRLDTGWGLISTIVLLLGSLTIATAVHCARTSQRQLLMLFLTLTMICGISFLGVNAIEYRDKIEAGVLAGRGSAPSTIEIDDTPLMAPTVSSSPLAGRVSGAPNEAGIDLAAGKRLYLASCAGCHGPSGDGIAGLGLPLRGSEFVRAGTQQSLVEFLKTGRQPGDPDSKMNALMPARGGNSFLSDDQLDQIMAHVRSLDDERSEGAAVDGGSAEVADASTPSMDEIEAMIPRWIGAPPPVKDQGVSEEFVRENTPPITQPSRPGQPPAHAAKFFGIYFLLTGLHGFHLLVGLGAVGWLLWRSSRWQFAPETSNPVKVGGLYWHLVAVIWIFLFPLLYLMR